MRFRTRTFLLSFLPVAVLLLGSFWAMQALVQNTVRAELLQSLRRTHDSLGRMQRQNNRQYDRFLRILAENATFKAGIQLLREEPGSAEARATVVDQLREMCATSGFDFLEVLNSAGQPLAGAMLSQDEGASADLSRLRPPARGFTLLHGVPYQVVSTAIDQGDENLGMLAVGEKLDFSGFGAPVVLTYGGRVIESNVAGAKPDEIAGALARCGDRPECEVKLANSTYLSLAMSNPDPRYSIRTLQNLDAALRPAQAVLQMVFVGAGLASLALAAAVSIWSSRSIVKPISTVVRQLRESEETGLLPEFSTQSSSVLEIGELMAGFQRASVAIREGRNKIERAYVEFVRSLANALDARDPYTAGHSRRVSEYSCAIARELQVREEELEELRTGALLHDIGKIGVLDSVLRKPGALTDEEFAMLKEHPVIGRNILEGVEGFRRYLDVVELHHENWNGKGYPHGRKETETPLAARIVKVADAYDAMTSDRPYRRGLSHDEAVRRLNAAAGSEFDPAIVPALIRGCVRATSDEPSLRNLAAAVEAKPLTSEAALPVKAERA